MSEKSLSKWSLVDLPKIVDNRGNLTFIEENRHFPFDIMRVYYLYDVPGGAVRAGHAHRNLRQMLVAVSGSFDILLDDGATREVIALNRAHKGLLVMPGVWREIYNFSSGAVCLALASDHYDESDYFRDYESFKVFSEQSK
jgi:dTDP-4-dehydrorhamnose 3,5-epimerase-like enzyme